MFYPSLFFMIALSIEQPEKPISGYIRRYSFYLIEKQDGKSGRILFQKAFRYERNLKRK
jgi:hypothetical protein